ncbi:hypothetical protein AX16_003309 [Volvariella volvacea WC 439]|nr:hypothetical protein AX16_003309 [Volvariella volvacea WC 439]
MSTTIRATQPRFPREIERMIFEIAARDGKQNVLPQLMKVAWRVRLWLRPILYETVRYPVVKGDFGYARGQSRHYIHNLCLFGDAPSLSALDFLATCPNVYNLALWCKPEPHRTRSYTFPAQYYPSSSPGTLCVSPSSALQTLTHVLTSPFRHLNTPPLLRLSAYLATSLFYGRPIDYNHLIFKNLTHLEILDLWPSSTRWQRGNNLGCLKELRYLAFSYAVWDMEIVRNVLRECGKLELLIMWGVEDVKSYYRVLPKTRQVEMKTYLALVNLEGKGEDLAGENAETMAFECQDVPEDRVVLNLPSLCGGVQKDWKRGAEGGADFWVRGGWIVETRRGRWVLREGCKATMGTGLDLGQWMSVLEDSA